MIVNAVRKKRLREPFSTEDFRRACRGLGKGTYRAFLYKHRKGNPGGYKELFKMLSTNQFTLLRPIKHGL